MKGAKTTAKYLTPEAKLYIEDQIHDYGEITTEEVMELIVFDPQSAREQQIRKVAHRIMYGMRDEKQVRTCFAVKKDGESVYVNIDKSTNLNDLTKVRKQLGIKFDGLNRSIKKVKQKTKEVQGQVSMFDTKIS